MCSKTSETPGAIIISAASAINGATAVEVKQRPLAFLVRTSGKNTFIADVDDHVLCKNHQIIDAHDTTTYTRT
jgi:hypothetical protein